MILPRAASAILLVLIGVIAAPRAAEAQYPTRSAPPDGYDYNESPAGADREDGVTTRVDRLERELRRATGQIEELQHQVQVLEDQLRARPDSAALPPPVVGRAPTNPAGGPPRDAFDPAASPSATGAPRPLGQTTPSAPLTPNETTRTGVREPGAPMDLTPPGLQGAPSASRPGAEASPASSMKDEYDQAAALMQQQQYEAAERALTAFLAKYPKSKYVPAATFGLGESFFMRSRFREAAEKFLDIKKKHPQSAQTPEALLRLGQSLAEIGAHDEACQSFAEIGASYPGSPARVRESALREIKKHQC